MYKFLKHYNLINPVSIEKYLQKKFTYMTKTKEIKKCENFKLMNLSSHNEDEDDGELWNLLLINNEIINNFS